MQEAPLLKRKNDWCFSSESWTFNYPNTSAICLAKPISDQVPCIIKVGTSIPKANIFRFENYWLQIPDFKEVVQNIWGQDLQIENCATRITAKFKRLRKGLNLWSKKISNLAQSTKNSNEMVLFLDVLEEYRPLVNEELNGREIVKQHLMKLLQYESIYWKQRATIRWVKFGDGNTKLFMLKLQSSTGTTRIQ